MACPTNKVVHTFASATAAAKRARRRTETPLAPYHCDLCGAWHVGTKNGLKKPVKTINPNHQMGDFT